MRTHAQAEVRCKLCNALLAKYDRDGLSIRRGEMQATITGSDFTLSATCYRCKTLNVVTSSKVTPPTAGAPALAPHPA